MTAVLLITGSILLIVIMAFIYRILNLVSIAKDTKKSPVGLSNKVNAFLFLAFLILGSIAIIWYSDVAKENFLPEASSVHGVEVDAMFWTTMAIIGFAFIVTHILLFFFPFRYQYRVDRKAHFYPHNDMLEIVWTIVPAVVMAGLVISGAFVWNDITGPAPEENRVEVEIMGKQFNWQVRYGGKDGQIGRYNYQKIDATNSMGIDFRDPNSIDDFIPREIHVPKGANVLLKIRSRDVLHSVFMPHFRLKMDAVPGMQTKFWFIPTKTTAEMRLETGNPDFNYELACTEICGSGHFAMKMIVVVDEPAEYQEWYASQESWASKNIDYISSLEIPDLDLAAIE